MPSQEYFKLMHLQSNQVLTLAAILAPFGVEGLSRTTDEFLLVGHVLEELHRRHADGSFIDPLDVAASAYELGHDPALQFLEEGPTIMALEFRKSGMDSLLH